MGEIEIMLDKMIRRIQNFIHESDHPAYDPSLEYEFCPRCEANLTLQKGYDNSLLYWKCLGCGEMLVNPLNDTDSGIVWICDKCQAMLNVQPNFTEECGKWKCTECGHENAINLKEVYASDDEYQRELKNPYRGLCDEDMLDLSLYEDIGLLGNRENVILVRHRESGTFYVKKILTTYDFSIYRFLMKHPVPHMPKIIRLYEGKEVLIVMEEWIPGETLESILEKGPLPLEKAIWIAIDVCGMLNKLHHLEKPIVHRDIKPANVMITTAEEVWLLDMNVAKWHKPEEKEDTRHMGTWNYAAPEQVGYGMTASSPKTDVYAVGMLLNVMLTGEFPKDKQATEPAWSIIERCIRLDANGRYTAAELAEALGKLCEEGTETKIDR